MVGRINKILSVIILIAINGVIAPKDTFNQTANALEINEVTKASSGEALISSAISAVQNVGESEKLSAMNSIIALNISGGTQKVSLSSTCIGNLCYEITEDKAEEIKDLIIEKMDSSEGEELTETLIKLATDSSYADYKKDALIVLGALSELKIMAAKADAGDTTSESELITEIQTLASSIPIYQYTGVKSTGISSQGFTAGGVIGLMTTPSETYNASARNAEYIDSDTIPVLSLTGRGTFDDVINLSDSNMEVVCDGININVVDSKNNKLYCINNPVYNMFITSNGGTASTYLNIISFPDEITNIEGSTTEVSLESEGIEEISILSLSLGEKTSSSASRKNYKYATTIDEAEESLLNSSIDNMNLATTISNFVKSKIQAGTFIMIPNLSADIEDTINGITDTIDDLSDALNDLTDAINDSSDDVDDAWDKVFDRFDNDEGWERRDGYIYYYDEDGVSLKGVQKIDGKTYYFNRIDGAMETGWQIVDNKRCYFDKKKGYQLFNQWIQDNDDWYFLSEDGAVKKMEWINVDGKNYYLKADGKMVRGWFKIDDYWYYFDKDGSMETSTWKWSNDKWYYLKDNGQAANDWLQLGTKWYYFKDLSGEMQTGWFRANGSWYCSNADGSMKIGWVYSENGWCYLDEVSGKMKKNEWVTIDGKTYYFNINGTMVTGSRYIDGTKYIFNSDGTLSQN